MFRFKIKVFYLLSIWENAIRAIIVPFLLIYIWQNGVSQLQIGIISSAYFLTKLIFSSLFGSISDVIGRKKALTLGSIIEITFYIIFYIGRDYFMFLLAYLINGFAQALTMASLSSWELDNIKAIYGESKWVKYLSKIKIIGDLSFIISSILAFFCFLWLKTMGYSDLQIIRFFILICILISIIKVITILLGEEIKKCKKRKEERFLKKFLKNYDEFIKLTKENPCFKIILMIMFLYSVGYFILYTIYFLYLKLTLEIPEQFYNLIFLTSTIISIVIVFFNEKLVKHLKGEKKPIICFSLISSFLIILSGLTRESSLLSLVLLILVDGLCCGIHPIFVTFLNKPIPSEIRATAYSIVIMAGEIGCLVGGLVYGIVANNYGLTSVLYLSGFLILLGTVPFLFMKTEN